MAVPYTFSTATGSLPLSQLDSNFSTAITIGNTAVVLGDTITTINNLTLGNVAITSVSAAFPNGYLANSNVIVGTTTLTLGSTVTSINGLSLSNVTISSGNVTISNVTTTNVTATTANVTTANVGTLVVIGDATVGGNTTVTGNITAAKGTFTSANVTGTANVQVIAVTQNATVAGNATVTGNVSAANGTFTSANVSGTANVSTLAVVINATIGGNAAVTGNVSMNVATITTANVSGTANISTLVITANQTSLGNITATGNVTAAKLIPTGTSVTGNGLYLPAANALGLSTNGTNAVYIDSSQNVGIGSITPSGARLRVEQPSSIYGNSTPFQSWAYAAKQIINLQMDGSTNPIWNTDPESYWTPTAVMIWQYRGTERMRIDTSGNVGIGTSSPTVPLQIYNATSAAIQVDGDATSLIRATRYSTDTNGPTFQARKARGTFASPTTVASGDTVATFQASAYGGTNYRAVGAITTVVDTYTSDTNISGYLTFQTNSGSTATTERMRIDSVGNAQFQAGAVMPYAPAPTGIAAATTLTNANIQGQIISATGTTYTITMPLGTTMETLATWVTTNVAYDFFVINTASGIITMAVNTGVTSLGSLTVAIGASAHFRIRRTAANTFVLYRLV